MPHQRRTAKRTGPPAPSIRRVRDRRGERQAGARRRVRPCRAAGLRPTASARSSFRHWLAAVFDSSPLIVPAHCREGFGQDLACVRTRIPVRSAWASARLSGQVDAMASRLPPRVRGCRYTLACIDQMIRTAVRSSRAPVLPPPADEVTCYPRRQRRRGPLQRLCREAGRGRLERSGGPRRRCQRLVIIPARQRVVAIAGWNYQKPIRGAK